MAKLGDVCNIYSGFALKSFNDANQGIPVIKIGNILSDGTLSLDNCQYTDEKVNEKYYSVKGDIYIALSGATTGKIGQFNNANRYIINQRVGIVRNKCENIPTDYIKYFLFNKTEKILMDAAGCAQPNISPNQISQYEIPLLSFDKMKQIAAILDKVTDLINKRRQQLEKLDELVKSRFVEMFGDIKSNPNGYPIRSFDEISILITDGEHATPRRTEDGIYLLSARNILNHALQLNDVDYIDEEEYNRIARRITPQSGDVLISCSGSIGRCCVVPNGLKFQMVRSVALIRFDDTINPVFAEWLITSDDLQQQIAQSATQSSQANLFQGKIRRLYGYVPPMELQTQFSNFVESVDRSKQHVKESLEKLETLKKSLMQEYFG